jgi:hypothetical protein
MSDEASSPDGLSEVLRLCIVLSDRALDALITAGVVPEDQAAALAKAARLLLDHGVEWPPLLTHVMHELADKSDRAVPRPEPPPFEGGDLEGLTRFFTGFCKEDQT